MVKTMKALAAVNIRQYERAVESLKDYNRTVELGLQAVLRDTSQFMVGARSASSDRAGAVIFGTDQGMAGALNEQVLSHALSSMEALGLKAADRTIMVVGERLAGLLEDAGQPVADFSFLPSSVAGITPKVQDMLIKIESWNQEKKVDHVYLFYSLQTSGATYQPHTVHLLPIDKEWLRNLQDKSWPNRSLPLCTMAWGPLFSSLIREYLFVSLFRAFAESLASENASRLAAMQGAEKNIEEMLAELNSSFHQRRQTSITEELLDIVVGFEALKERQ